MRDKGTNGPEEFPEEGPRHDENSVVRHQHDEIHHSKQFVETENYRQPRLFPDDSPSGKRRHGDFPEEFPGDGPQDGLQTLNYETKLAAKSEHEEKPRQICLERSLPLPHQAEEEAIVESTLSTSPNNFASDPSPGAYAITPDTEQRRSIQNQHFSMVSVLSEVQTSFRSTVSESPEIAPEPLISATLVEEDGGATTESSGGVFAEAKPVRFGGSKLLLALVVVIVATVAIVVALILTSYSGGNDDNARSPERDDAVPPNKTNNSSTEAPTMDESTIAPTELPTIYASWGASNGEINGLESNDFQGASVAFSNDGRILATGCPGARLLAGLVRVYQKNVNNNGTVTWSLIGDQENLHGTSPSDLLGFSVALSGDGLTLAAGAIVFGAATSSPGYVLVFRFDLAEQVWKPLGEPIVGDVASSSFGMSVALSEDGNILAVGATFRVGRLEPGNVRVFQYDQTAWKMVAEIINGYNDGDELGVSVDLSADGSVLAVGAHQEHDDSLPGYVRVFRLVDNSWKQIGLDLVGSDLGEMFGWSVKLSRDGSKMAIGSVAADASIASTVADTAGKVAVFENVNGSWQRMGQTIVGRRAGDMFGISLDLSDDGTTFAVGAWRADSSPEHPVYARVFRYVNSQWLQLGSDIHVSDVGPPVAYVDFGLAVSVSRDGRWLCLGNMYAYTVDSTSDETLANSGYVAVYEIPDVA